MKKILLIIALFIPSILLSDDSSHLINKAIVCEEGSNNFKSMYGFKFIDGNDAVEHIKNKKNLYHYGYQTHYNAKGYTLTAEHLSDILNLNNN